MSALRIRKRLGGFSLDLDLTLSRRVTGLYGPSGSGKTSILNSIAGLLRPDSGRITAEQEFVLFDSEAGIDLPARKRRIGYVFQDALLFEHMTVARNLEYGRPRASSTMRNGFDFDLVVRVLEIGHLLDRRARHLSGGEKRRVAIGRALLSNPSLLLLDEPLTGLDRRLAGRTLAFVREVLETFRIPAIYVSHWVSDIIHLCDEVVLIDRGRCVGQGEPTRLIAEMEALEPLQPPALKNIFQAPVTTVDATVGTAACDLHGQALTVPVSAAPATGEVTLMIPARDIILATEKPRLLSARNVLRGRIARVQAVGTHCVVFVDVGVEWMVEVTKQAAYELGLAAGQQVYAIVKASTIHCIDGRG